MDYPGTLRFLYSLGNEVKAAKLGLERMELLLAELGNPHRDGFFVHVAGTNGKGSTCAMIESALRAAVRRTGLYTSPHLSEPTERIRIAGEPVSRDFFVAAFERVHQAAERLIADEVFDAHPTYFETVTAMGFLIFKQAGCDAVVLEVGLGGRLDATNVVKPRLAVITPIDFDHEVFLGRGLESIAAEKAGILKPGCPALISPQRPEVEGTLSDCAAAAGIIPARTSEWQVERLDIHRDGCRFVAAKSRQIRVDCPLRGEHQATNALTAVAALDLLAIPPDAIEQGICRTQWPGRLELVSRNPEVILDGAHNPAGARALAAYIRRFYSARHITLVYGAMRDKAVAEIAGILFPLAEEVILTAPRQARAVNPETIREMVDHPRMRVAPTLQRSLEMTTGDVVFVTGSLYLVGDARGYFVK